MGNENSTTCKEKKSLFCDEFIELVQLVLDGEAPESSLKKFKEYYMTCGDCISYYDLESTTVEFIKSKLKEPHHNAPMELSSAIKDQVQHLT